MTPTPDSAAQGGVTQADVIQSDRDLVSALAKLKKADGLEGARLVVARHRLASSSPAQQAGVEDALREALAGFVADLTDAGRNRGTCLSINHDRLNARIKKARAALGTGESEA